MNSMFIYVFSEEDRNKMLSLGYSMLKECDDNKSNGKVYIFLDDNDNKLSFSSIECVRTNTLFF